MTSMISEAKGGLEEKKAMEARGGIRATDASAFSAPTLSSALGYDAEDFLAVFLSQGGADAGDG